MPVQYGTKPFQEQVKFFRRKLNIGTAGWTDLWQGQHDHAFVVAGAMKADLLQDLNTAVRKAIEQGATLAEFRKDFDAIVQKYGWGYNGGRNWRTRVIYETNLRTSYQAGRYKQMQAISHRRPYWQYNHSNYVKDPRPEHLSWDGLILRHDDPWWDTHYPPNGWGCRCSVRTLAERDMKRLGKTGPDKVPPIEWETRTVGKRSPVQRTVEVPKGIDPGWAYAPGKEWHRAFVKDPLDPDAWLKSLPAHVKALATLPPLRPRPYPKERILPKGLPEQDYVEAFLAEFGMSPTDRYLLYEDVTGELLVISDKLFREASGKLKVTKRGREQYIRMLAETIQNPQEIWLSADGGNLRRRYVVVWDIEGSNKSALAVFETQKTGWVGVTALVAGDIDYILRRVRIGERIYQQK